MTVTNADLVKIGTASLIAGFTASTLTGFCLIGYLSYGVIVGATLTRETTALAVVSVIGAGLLML